MKKDPVLQRKHSHGHASPMVRPTARAWGWRRHKYMEIFFMDRAISDSTPASRTRESETSVELLVQAGRGAGQPQQDPIAVKRGLSTSKSPLVPSIAALVSVLGPRRCWSRQQRAGIPELHLSLQVGHGVRSRLGINHSFTPPPFLTFQQPFFLTGLRGTRRSGWSSTGTSQLLASLLVV